MDEKKKMRRNKLAMKRMEGMKKATTVQSPDNQYNTGMMGKQPVSVYPLMGKIQKKGEAQAANLAYARTGEAAKYRGEMGYNPSGTQGAKGTEGKFMNPKIYR